MIKLQDVINDLRRNEWYFYINKPFIWLGFLGFVLAIFSFFIEEFIGKLLMLFSGVLIGLFINYISNIFGSDNNGWLHTAESCCKQILKAITDIDGYLVKEQRDGSFCSVAESVIDDNKDVLLVKKHCELVDSKFRSLRGDLHCVFSDWQNFINTNCKEGECQFIWDRIYSVVPSDYEEPVNDNVA